MELNAENGPLRIRRDVHIDSWSIRLYYWSREPRILLAVAVVILSLSLLAAWYFRLPDLDLLTQFSKQQSSLETELNKPQPDFATVIRDLRLAATQITMGIDYTGEDEETSEEGQGGPESFLGPGGEVLSTEESFEIAKEMDTLCNLILSSRLKQGEKNVAQAYVRSVATRTNEPNAELLWLAHQARPLPHANELVGDFHRIATKPDKAIRYYEREIEHCGTESARAKLVALLMQQKQYEKAAQLAKEPVYSKHFSPEQKVELFAESHDWAALAPAVNEFQWQTYRPIPVTLAIVAGLAWFLIALQAIQPQDLISFRTIVPVFAVLMGALSTWPTLYAVIWEEKVWHLKEGDDFIFNIWFYIGGVGVREELIKLLFFFPFLPSLVRRRQPLEVLIVAGCVGLGFAMEENLLYFNAAGPQAAFARFLTANFFHMALTGIAGLAVYTAVVEPKTVWRSIVTFVVLILTHGLYDAFGGNIGMIVFLLCSLFFFRVMRTLRDGMTDQFSLAATLVIGISCVVGTILICASMTFGFVMALFAIGVQAIFLGMMVYMFYWQLGEAMVPQAPETAPDYSPMFI